MLLLTTTTPMETILGQVTNITTLVGDVFTMITGNAYLTIMAAVGLIFIAIRVFKGLKRAAR